MKMLLKVRVNTVKVNSCMFLLLVESVHITIPNKM